MGGRAAEELLFHEVTGGASNDFEKANQIATTMVTKLGHGPRPRGRASDGTSGRGSLSFLVARPDGGRCRPRSRRPRRGRSGRSSTAPTQRRCETLIAHMATLRRIAAYLVEHERVDGETFEALFDGRVEVATADGEWRPETARPRDWADILPFRERRGRAPVVVPAPSDALDAPTPIPLPIPAAIALDGLPGGELIEEPGPPARPRWPRSQASR